MNGVQEHAVPADFQWSPEHEQLLEKLATSDYVETDWTELRNMIKHKIDQNIASYKTDPPPPSPPPLAPTADSAPVDAPSSSPESATSMSPKPVGTGLKLPPFPRREVNEFVRNEYNSHGRSKTVLTEDEAKSMKEGIWTLLHEFEGHPPFSIQRVCELAVRPRKHYKYAGKYLRAVERALLVTSTIDVFPVLPPEDPSTSAHTFSPTSFGSLREATTPLFSPIPFLHEDARRSRSRSPPMSPLQLAVAPVGGEALGDDFRLSGEASTVAVVDSLAADALTVPGETRGDGPVIGLVDELDDPGPGHMSEHPTALSATTTTTEEPEAITVPSPRPMFGGSLGDRFVKSSSGEASNGAGAASGTADDGDAMAVDEPDADKENTKG